MEFFTYGRGLTAPHLHHTDLFFRADCFITFDSAQISRVILVLMI
jgi:hypothetical protein